MFAVVKYGFLSIPSYVFISFVVGMSVDLNSLPSIGNILFCLMMSHELLAVSFIIGLIQSILCFKKLFSRRVMLVAHIVISLIGIFYHRINYIKVTMLIMPESTETDTLSLVK